MNATQDPDSQVLCAMCNKPGMMQCGRCKCSRYCSQECQQSDWPVHKLLCKQLKDFKYRPAPNQIRAIYFPFDGPSPTFFWLTKYAQDTFDSSRIPALPSGQKIAFIDRIEENPVLHRATTTSLSEWECPDRESMPPCHNPSSRNKSLKKVDEELSVFATGPMLFHGHGKDLDTMDFRDIVDILRFDLNKEAKKRQRLWYETCEDVISTVQVSCLGDVEVCGHHAVQEHPIKASHFDMIPGGLNPRLGEAIEIPLQGKQIKHSLSWRQRKTIEGKDYASNPNMIWLMPSAIAEPIGGPIGTILIARLDKKPLLTAHIKALLAYGIQLQDDYLAASPHIPQTITPDEMDPSLDTQVNDTAEFIYTHASRTGFEKFYMKWLSAEEGKEYRGVAGPYEV